MEECGDGLEGRGDGLDWLIRDERGTDFKESNYTVILGPVGKHWGHSCDVIAVTSLH